jgi:hypothetical protein
LGSTLKVPAGQKFRGRASLNVISQAALDRVQILYNGEIIHEFSAGGASELTREFDISLDSSGWVAARAFEENPPSETAGAGRTVRFAHTNPIYIEIGSPMKPRRDAAKYYLGWCKELLAVSSADKERYATGEQKEEVESLYRRAIAFYEGFASAGK